MAVRIATIVILCIAIMTSMAAHDIAVAALLTICVVCQAALLKS